MPKADFLKQKAASFLEDAKYDIKTKKWFLAAFHLEQTCQLYLKYYLFKKLGDFPKIHSLNELLEEFKKISPQRKKEIEKIQKEEAGTIGDLNQAYITSRYLPVEFNKFQVDKMLKFTKKLIKFLKTYENAD
jgi:HEPN domain-containing protein